MFSKPSKAPNTQPSKPQKDHAAAGETAAPQSSVKAQPSTDSTTLDANIDIKNQLDELGSLFQSAGSEVSVDSVSAVDLQFRSCLMESISEGVIFVNQYNIITCWNQSTEIITGLKSNTMIGSEFTLDLLGLTTTSSALPDYLVSDAIRSFKEYCHECTLQGKSGRKVNVELTVLPVILNKKSHGAVILLKDLSYNKHLQQKLQDLRTSTSQDSLTGVANRATFEESFKQYIVAHRSVDSKCCLIICDIDFFKKINDTYGHHAGDQALVAFAKTLQEFVRSRDIVARYGGEEFVILCANCDLENAVARAEEIRMSLNRTPQAMLDGKTLAASFGVAELNDSEGETEFFVRADKALYAAKANGRNRVETATDAAKSAKRLSKSSAESRFDISSATGIQWRKLSKNSLYCKEFLTSTNHELLTGKLRGFVQESGAKILDIEENFASLEVVAIDSKNSSRRTKFRVALEFHDSENKTKKGQENTVIRITIAPTKQGIFRKRYNELYAVLVVEIRRFFMIAEDSAVVVLSQAATTSGREE